MNNRIIMEFAALVVCACGLPSFLSGTTPTAQVVQDLVFRPAADMNLQPVDVPDLEDVEPQQPSSEPIFPDV